MVEIIYRVYQIEDEGKCFGVVANVEFILIAKYGEEGKDAELVLYKKRM